MLSFLNFGLSFNVGLIQYALILLCSLKKKELLYKSQEILIYLTVYFTMPSNQKNWL